LNPPVRKELAVITGGAIRLGREIALGLAGAGYAIGLHYFHSQPEAEQTAENIKALGVPAYLLPADLCNPDEINSMFARVAGLPFRLSVLVNSAAAMPRGNIQTMPVSEWDETLDLNLRAPWLCAQSAARLMDETGGIIINISDTGAGKTWAGFPAYTVSKAGLEVLTRLLARALAPKIRVNAVAPGLILPSSETTPEEWQRLADRLPVKKSGTPRDVTEAILFLIRNRYITGETLHIDGGYQLL
jgi:NAD(P)-dependent dehydrogenase (short-subunit alcohol dehydrogenase family)